MRSLLNLGRASVAVVGVVALSLFSTSCDVSPVTAAVDSLSLIVDLPVINTVVAGQVVDASTLQPITTPVALTFGGADAAQVVDVYSDPITSETLTNGLVSFGLANAAVPSETAPVTFTVTAAADGYETRTQTVAISDAGSAGFVVSLTPTSLTAPIAGTVSTSAASGTATNGTLASTSTVVVGTLPGAMTASSVQFQAGETFSTASGTPLSGALTTEVRVLAGVGLDALPEAARVEAGVLSPVVAGIQINIRDASGNVAGQAGASASATPMLRSFERHTSGASRDVSAGAVTYFVGLNAETFGALQATVSAGNTLVAVYQHAILDCPVTLDAARQGLAVHGCFNDAITIQVKFASPQQLCTATARMQLTIEGSVPVLFKHVTVTNGSEYMSTYLGLGLAGHVTFNVFSLAGGAQVPKGDYTVTFELDDGRTISFPGVDLCGARVPATIPASSTAAAPVALRASVACPSGQHFNPQMTSTSLSALEIYYRRAGDGHVTDFLGGDDLNKAVGSGQMVVTGLARALEANTAYDFHVVWGTKSASSSLTTGAAGAQIALTYTAEELGLSCQ